MNGASSRAASDRLPWLAGLPRWLVRAAPLVGVAAGCLLLAWGQYEVSSNPAHVPFHWPLLHWFDHWLLTKVYRTRNAVGFALPLFIVGAAVVGSLVPMARTDQFERWVARVALTRRGLLITAAALTPPLLIWAYLVLRLANDHYDPDYRWWMAAAVFWVLCVFLAIDRAAGRLSWPSLRWPHLLEAALVVALAGTFIGINARDLSSWRYSAIGDEGAFWDMAQRVLRGDHLNWFSQEGVYGVFPIGSSVWQALVMRFFGSGLFGWKMAALLAIVLTFPMFYWLIRQLLGARVAAFSTLFLAASHYLFSYAHTGYDNIFPLFPTASALAFFVAGLRRSSYTLLFLAGLIAGAGWYTYYSSRATIAIIAAAVLFLGKRGWRPEIVASIGTGFILSVTPIFATNKYDVISKMLSRSSSETHQPLLEKVTQNAPRTFLAFSFNPNNIHYTAGALMDSLSFVIALIGIAVAIRGIRNENYRLIVIWWLIAGVVTGILSQYNFVSISRLHFMMLPMAAFAGIGVDRLIAAVSWPIDRPSVERVAAAAVFGALAPLLFVINAQHFFDYSAHHSPTTTETVLVREFTASSCTDASLRGYAYWRNPESLLVGLWKFFGRADSMPVQVNFADAKEAYGPYPQSGGTGCVAIQIGQPEAADLKQRLEASVPPGALRVVTDVSGESRVGVIAPGVPHPGLSVDAVSSAWRTDLSKGSGLDGVIQGQERDFIAPIDDPTFDLAGAVHGLPDEPVVVVTHNAETRAYPIHTLLRHGPVNDVIDGLPIAVTFDPIAGAARVYQRQLDGRTLTFGVTGLLRDGNALLYDHDTETWWQQLTGDAVTGELAGTKLTALPATVGTLAEFSATFHDGKVLTNDFDESAKSGNPYLGYDTPEGKPMFTSASVDNRLAPMTHVAVVDFSSKQIAVVFPDASQHVDQAFPIDANGHRAVLLFDARALSLLDRTHGPDSRHIGTFAGFLTGDGPDGVTLSPIGTGIGRFRDENGSVWSVYGRAVQGPGQGKSLEPLLVTTGFWFAIAARYPGIQVVYP